MVDAVPCKERNDLPEPAWRNEQDGLTQVPHTLRGDETLSPVDLSSLEILSAEHEVVEGHGRSFVPVVRPRAFPRGTRPRVVFLMDTFRRLTSEMRAMHLNRSPRGPRNYS